MYLMVRHVFLVKPTNIIDILHYIITITPIITIVIIIVVDILTAPWNPGHLASRGWSCLDAGQHGANPGHPGKSGTGGNPT